MAGADSPIFGAHFRKGVGARPLRLFIAVVFALLMTPLASAADRNMAEAFLASGAPALALDELGSAPSPEDGPEAWGDWARLRVQALAALDRPDKIERLAEGLPDGVGAVVRRRVWTHAARAALTNGRPAAARHRAMALLAEFPQAEDVRGWARLVYRAHAEEGRPADARQAIDGYRRARETTPAAQNRLEQARILAEAGASGAALDVLEPAPKTASARRLHVDLLLQAGETRQALEAARIWVEEAGEKGKGGAWLAVSRALRPLDRPVERLRALEKALSADDEVAVDMGRVWGAYLQRGEALANDAGLLVGEDGKWLDLASESEGLDRRALLASIAIVGRDAASRRKARLELLRSFRESDRPGAALRLFREGPAFQGEKALTPPVQVRLARLALEADRFSEARYWMESVSALPDKVTPAPWWLTRARLRIRMGAFQAGARDLERVLGQTDWWAKDGRVDKLLQVIFDLQEGEEHALAYRLFQAVRQVVADPATRRETLFWMAEARSALDDPIAAARLYLRAAGHPAGETGDRWNRTGRFRAAKALEETKYRPDARRLYKGLLPGAGADQRASIRRRLRGLKASGSHGSGT